MTGHGESLKKLNDEDSPTSLGEIRGHCPHCYHPIKVNVRWGIQKDKKRG